MSEISPSAEDLLQRIGFPESWEFNFYNARIIETHISVVILNDEIALKFKKSVKFDFLDYSSIEKRWKAAVKELSLNQRLSKGIYLGLFPVLNDVKENVICPIKNFDVQDIPCGLTEVAVVMQRIPEESLLSSLIEQDKVSISDHISPLSFTLSNFHKDQSANSIHKLQQSGKEHFELFEKYANENIALVQQHSRNKLTGPTSVALDVVTSYFKESLKKHRSSIEERYEKGLVVDGHGDLRAEHVAYLGSQVQFIDCIEFNDSLRFVDVLNDIAFLKMDLERLRRGDLSKAFLEQYQQHFPESSDSETLKLYSAYRAMVRAKICLLAELQNRKSGLANSNQDHPCASYLGLASRYALGLSNQSVIAIGGGMGTGKSTLAEQIKALSNAQLLQSDVIRKELYGQSKADRSLPFGQGKYSSEANRKTYDTLFNKASFELQRGNPVILDASFSKVEYRQEITQLALKHNAKHIFVYCQLDDSETRSRLEKRATDPFAISDGRWELRQQQMENFQVPKEDENTPVFQAQLLEKTKDVALKVIKTLTS